MKTSELTDRSLLQWLDADISQRIQTLEYYSQQRDALETILNNIRLGIRCIDGELPELAGVPWA